MVLGYLWLTCFSDFDYKPQIGRALGRSVRRRLLAARALHHLAIAIPGNFIAVI